MTTALEQIRRMPVDQRIQLVKDLWDTIVDEDVDFPLSSEQLMELDTRRTAMMADPSNGIPWIEAKSWLLAGLPNVNHPSCSRK